LDATDHGSVLRVLEGLVEVAGKRSAIPFRVVEHLGCDLGEPESQTGKFAGDAGGNANIRGKVPAGNHDDILSVSMEPAGRASLKNPLKQSARPTITGVGLANGETS